MIDYAKYTLTDHYLLLEAGGLVNSLMELIGGTDRVNDKAKAVKANKILANFLKISFDVKLPDAFNLVRYYESKVQEFKNIHIAAVVNKKDFEIGKFWESICNKRGFNAAIFTDVNEAHDWLVMQQQFSNR